MLRVPVFRNKRKKTVIEARVPDWKHAQLFMWTSVAVYAQTYFEINGQAPPHHSPDFYGDRAFYAAAPKLWNTLPLELRSCTSIDTFKKSLKTYLFEIAHDITTD